MKRIVFSLIFSIFIGISEAALPPQYQNQRDLNVMVEYIREHPIVASVLKQISLKNFTIYFDDSCEVIFGRQEIDRPYLMPGPLAPLEFKRATCPVD
jgi:hypothetical protein